MFVGRMFLTLKSARDLQCTTLAGMGEVKPYLIVQVDDEEKERIGYKENVEVVLQISTYIR